MTDRSAVARVRRAFARIAEVDRPEVWITLRDQSDVEVDAATVDARLAAGEPLALAGLVLAVKDNIDVVGLPTTAACPGFAYEARVSATAVTRLVRAGAVVIGKTNLDQFATGLVGTRSPYGAVRDVRRPDRVAGGSSSGSAVAVALGIADIALATDTAGSGRVPAAFQGIVGVKPTRGLVPTTGVVPACSGIDCVSVFADDLSTARLAMALMAGPDAVDTGSRSWPADAPLAAPARPVVGVPDQRWIGALGVVEAAAYERAMQQLEGSGAVLVSVDIDPMLAAGRLLYEGAFVAGRYAAVGGYVEQHPDEVDPSVRDIILGAREITGAALRADEVRLASLAALVRDRLAAVDAVVLPTAPRQPTIAEVAADPLGVNAELGVFTNFCNLLDLCAVAVPAGMAGEGCFGVTVFAPAFHDAVAADIASRLAPASGDGWFGPPGIELAVFGAHLAGQPLNGQLSGSRLLGPIATAHHYGLVELATDPPKPGLVRLSFLKAGVSIAGELWRVPVHLMAKLLADLPRPMAFGPVELDDGREVVGFLCQPDALDGARDISSFGSWPAYLSRGSA
jgi:allophanate hydrolase